MDDAKDEPTDTVNYLNQSWSIGVIQGGISTELEVMTHNEKDGAIYFHMSGKDPEEWESDIWLTPRQARSLGRFLSTITEAEARIGTPR